MKNFLLLLLPVLLAAQGGRTGQAGTGNVENGKRLFTDYGCYQCHGWAGQGGRSGARVAATALNAAGVIRYVRRPTGQMPAYTDKVVSDQELTDITAYLKTFPVATPSKDIPLLNQMR